MNFDKWISQLKYEGITDRDFDKARNLLKKKFGKNPSIRDVIWFIFNQKVIKDISKGYSGTYYTMALFIDEEGQNPTDLLSIHAEAELNLLKREGVVKEIKICTGVKESCENCRKLEHLVMTVDEALKKKLLPCKNCTRRLNSTYSFCRCFYRPETFFSA